MSLRLARWLLRYWLALGRLKELVLVVRFRILLRSLEVVELLEGYTHASCARQGFRATETVMVPAGPLQGFHHAVLAEAGMMG